MYNKKWKEAISKSAIFTFTHFMVSVGIAALIFFNLGNVFLTKVAALKIPVLSATCGALLTLWSI
jgi:orotate phosphoribosyltransferase